MLDETLFTFHILNTSLNVKGFLIKYVSDVKIRKLPMPYSVDGV